MTTDQDLTQINESIDQVLITLKSISNPDRLTILCHLSKQELNVTQIEEITGVRQPTLSQQLMILRKSGLVHTRREGKQIFYSLQDEKLIELLKTLHQLYCPQLNNEYEQAS